MFGTPLGTETMNMSTNATICADIIYARPCIDHLGTARAERCNGLPVSGLATAVGERLSGHLVNLLSEAPMTYADNK